jgi:hypothetical protein
MGQIWPANPTGATFTCLISIHCSWTRLPRSKKTFSLLALGLRSGLSFFWSQAWLVLTRATGEDNDTSPLTHRHGTAPHLLVVVLGDATKPRRARQEEDPASGRGRPRSRLRSWRQNRDGASSPEPTLTAGAARGRELPRARTRARRRRRRRGELHRDCARGGDNRGWSSPALAVAPTRCSGGRGELH